MKSWLLVDAGKLVDTGLSFAQLILWGHHRYPNSMSSFPNNGDDDPPFTIFQWLTSNQRLPKPLLRLHPGFEHPFGAEKRRLRAFVMGQASKCGEPARKECLSRHGNSTNQIIQNHPRWSNFFIQFQWLFCPDLGVSGQDSSWTISWTNKKNYSDYKYM